MFHIPNDIKEACALGHQRRPKGGTVSPFDGGYIYARSMNIISYHIISFKCIMYKGTLGHHYPMQH